LNKRGNHICGDAVRESFEAMWNVKLNKEPGLRIPNMFDAAIANSFMALYVHGEDILQSDPNTKHCSVVGHGSVIVHDLFLNEKANHALPCPSEWQKAYDEQARHSRRIAPVVEAAE
jgi:predicted molibdopterin-dependent oxidoreductase YjgC